MYFNIHSLGTKSAYARQPCPVEPSSIYIIGPTGPTGPAGISIIGPSGPTGPTGPSGSSFINSPIIQSETLIPTFSLELPVNGINIRIPFEPQNSPFISTWSVKKSKTISIGLQSTDYEFYVDWDDNSPLEYVDSNLTTNIINNLLSHTYMDSKKYKIRMFGIITSIDMTVNGASASDIISIEQFGDTQMNTLVNAFKNCRNLQSVDTTGDLSLVTDCTNAWENCDKISSFDAIGLTNITNCKNAWTGNNPYTTQTFKNLTSSSIESSTDYIFQINPPFSSSGNSFIGFIINQTDNLFTINELRFTDETGTINWGDGMTENYAGNNKCIQHYYSDITKTYVIQIENCQYIDNSNNPYIYSIYSVGTSQLLELLSSNNKHLQTVSGNFDLLNQCSFKDCKNLEFFDVSSLPNLENLKEVWKGCSSLTSFDASGLTSCTIALYAWEDCSSLTSFDASGLTSLQNADSAWRGCSSLTSFDASELKSLQLADSAWRGCSSLTSFDASGLITCFFANSAWRCCTSITSFYTSGLTSLQNAQSAWEGCSSLTSFNASVLTSLQNAQSAWEGCSSLTSFNASVLTSLQNAESAWEGCSSLTSFDASGLTSLQNLTNAWFNGPTFTQDSFTNSNISDFELTGYIPGPYTTSNPLISDYDDPFMIKWETTGANEKLSIIFPDGYIYDLKIMWGDDNVSDVKDPKTVQHNYATEGIYEVTISGKMPTLKISNSNLISIDSLGSTGLITLNDSFIYCTQLTDVITTEDFHNNSLVKLTSCVNTWKGCTSLTKFDAKGLINVEDCTDAWKNTTEFKMTEFTEYTSLIGVKGFNFNSSTSTNPNPILTGGEGFNILVDIPSDGFDFSIKVNSDIKNCTIDWGDNSDVDTVDNVDALTHRYSAIGKYQIKVVNASQIVGITKDPIKSIINVDNTYPTIQFEKCSNLTSVLLNKCKDTSFSECVNLERCIIQETKNSSLSFEKCSNLCLFEIDKIEENGDFFKTFKNCSNLYSFAINNGLSNILNAQSAWEGCSSLTSFNTSGLTSLQSAGSAWKGCSSLTSFNTSGLTSLQSAESAWEDCSSLTSFNTSGLTSLQYAVLAWDGCSSLTSFDASGLTSLQYAESAWERCSSLTSFNTSELKSLQNAVLAWRGCTSLTSFDASELKSLENAQSAWEVCSSLTSFNTSGLTLLENAQSAWKGCTKLTTFNIVNMSKLTNLTSAWEGCTGLTTFTIGDLNNIQEITSSWKDCTSLTTINGTIPNVTNINSAWENCCKLTTFDVESLDLVESSDSTWKNCSSLTSFNTSLSLLKTADSTWENCRLLKTFTTQLQSITVLNSAWKNCLSLTGFDIPMDALTNATSAWQGCTSLTGFDITMNALTDATSAWQGCTSLTGFDITMDALTNATSAWQGCTSLTGFDITMNALTNATSAWQGCTSLTGFNPASFTDKNIIVKYSWIDGPVFKDFFPIPNMWQNGFPHHYKPGKSENSNPRMESQ